MPTNQQPLLSVIVPVYNSGAYLRVCMESLVAQDCGAAVEFICVNDGSTDGSPQELEAWAAQDSRVRVLHRANGGYGKAMNVGMEAARGEYIGIVEPDDWAEPDMCSTLLELAARTRADIVKGSYAEDTTGFHMQTRVFGVTKRAISMLPWIFRISCRVRPVSGRPFTANPC